MKYAKMRLGARRGKSPLILYISPKFHVIEWDFAIAYVLRILERKYLCENDSDSWFNGFDWHADA